jgi:hypothetical protein
MGRPHVKPSGGSSSAGRNRITRHKGPGQAVELFRQFSHPLALLLWAAAGLAVLGFPPSIAECCR